MVSIKKNDTVQVISGKDAGKQGTILAISRKKGKVLVKGVALATKHAKPRRQGEIGSIKVRESFIDISKVQPVCNSCSKPTRIGTKTVEGGKSARVCIRCEELL
ncbi:MAG: 50S ribosomal protein L24 [Candidatus Babeliales bacterium]